MRDYITIGNTPHAEPCLQQGYDISLHRWRESVVFKKQILRYYPAPEGAEVVYHENEMACFFELNNQAQIDWALAVEADTENKLEKWDEDSVLELRSMVRHGRLNPTYKLPQYPQ